MEDVVLDRYRGGGACLLGSSKASNILPAYCRRRVQHLTFDHLPQLRLVFASSPNACWEHIGALTVPHPDELFCHS